MDFKFGVFLFINFICIHQISATYFWRDFNGSIPNDAVPGGTENGVTTYMGQVLHENPHGKLIFGKIDEAKAMLIYTLDDKVLNTDKNVKVLCGKRLHKFGWIENTAVKTIDERTLVIGGYDTSYRLYVGKLNLNNDVHVGKVTLEKPNDGMCYVTEGKAECTKNNYVILTYPLD